MIYKFKSKASGDLIMLKPHGDLMLELIGRQPADKGIIEVQDMAIACAELESAVSQDEASAEQDEGEPKTGGVSLQQRLWPMIEMLRRCQAAGEPIVWGV